MMTDTFSKGVRHHFTLPHAVPTEFLFSMMS